MGKNTDPSPMEYVSTRRLAWNTERANLARDAGNLKAEEIRAKAVELGITVTGAKSKEDLVEAVQTAVNPQ